MDRLLPELLLALSLLAVAGNAAQHGPIKKANWEAACMMAGETRKIQALGAHNIATAAEATLSYIKQALKTMIGIEVNRAGEYTREETALIAYYAAKADDAATSLHSENIGKQTNAIAAAARLDGRIVEFVNMAAKIADADTRSCLAEGADNTFRPSSTEFTGAAAACKDSVAAVTPAADLPSKFTTTGYDGDNLKGPADVAGTAGSHGCALTTGKNSNKIVNQGGATNAAAKPAFAGGLFEWTTNQLQNTDLQTLSTTEASYPTLYQAHKAYLTVKEDVKAYTTPTPATLKADPKMQELYKVHVIGQPPDNVKSVSGIESKIEAAYKQGDELAKKYDKDFAETNVYNPNKAEPKAVKLADLHTLQELITVLLHHRHDNQQKLKDKITELQKTINKSTDKTPEQICNAIGDKNESKCNTTKRCVYKEDGEKDKKCTLSEEAKQKAEKETEKDRDTGGGAGDTTGCSRHGIDKEKCENKKQAINRIMHL
uniref:Variant surface glycoprotein 1125.4325 n=1 Tax=Trypanosoma brucei TaxID=5691 RepID=A0A1J0RAD6_9TRYP|nr:variant surface glycoprotein 1125.4325 [Trypanosoma brucei]